jgi:hypothetical protein
MPAKIRPRGKPKAAAKKTGKACAIKIIKGTTEDDGSLEVLRPDRRDALTAAGRVISDKKLDKKLSPEVLAGRRTKDGLSMKEYIANAIQLKRNAKERLTAKFWVHFYNDFNLMSNPADRIARPPADQMNLDKMDKELLDRLALVHHDNPASRDQKPLVEYLKLCSAVSYAELHLMLGAVQEGPKITRTAAMKLHIAVLDYIHRTCVRPHTLFNR